MKVRNLQNWDRDPEVRNFIIPYNPGEILLEADLSQAEARIVAWKAKEKTQMELFNSGKKVHEFFGSIVVGEQITKKSHPAEYETAKRAIHGSNYGMAPARLAEILLDELGLAVPVAECKRWQNIYFQTFPRIRTGYHVAIQEELRVKLKTITTPPLGMQRKFYAPWGDGLFREAYAHYPQNIVAWLTNQALNKLYYESWLRDHIYMQVHDSIMLSVPENKLEEAARLLSVAMTIPLEIEGDVLTIPVEMKVGHRWGSMKDYHLPVPLEKPKLSFKQR